MGESTKKQITKDCLFCDDGEMFWTHDGGYYYCHNCESKISDSAHTKAWFTRNRRMELAILVDDLNVELDAANAEIERLKVLV